MIVPVDYEPRRAKVSQVLQKHHRAMIRQNPELAKQGFSKPPMAALRQGPNLRRRLCRSRLYPVSRGGAAEGANTRPTKAAAAGWNRCCNRWPGRDKQCKVCPLAKPAVTEVVGQVTKYTHKITQPVTCNTENVIYYWSCNKSNCDDIIRGSDGEIVSSNEYVGKSRRQFKERLSEHRDYVKRGEVEQPSGEHFSKPGHSVHNLSGLVLEQRPFCP